MEPDHEPRGLLSVVGLGPGASGLVTPEAAAALEAADVVVGYRGYLDLIANRLGDKEVVGFDLGQEVERAEAALLLAELGRRVALVSSGDAGVYGMGGVVHEVAAARGTTAAIVVVPGVTAALAAAARLGAPLAHDWACISLSDLLTPWPVIEKRLRVAAEADFVAVLYNPRSRARARHLTRAAAALLGSRPRTLPVGIVENAYRAGERVEIVTLDDLLADRANVTMFSTVIVGNSNTFVAGGRMITPRIHAAKHTVVKGDDTSRHDHPAETAQGAAITAESFAIIDRELGSHPVDRAERAILRRVIHASADFEFARTLRFGPGAIEAAIAALRRGATIVTDVEMLRAGVSRRLAQRLGVAVVCCLNDDGIPELAAMKKSTRTAMGIAQAAAAAGDGVIAAIGNAPTALEVAIDLVQSERWRPACIIGIPVGFVGVDEAKRRLFGQERVPAISGGGRKGGSAVTAAVLNALLELAHES